MNNFLEELIELMKKYNVCIESDIDEHTINIIVDDEMFETNLQNINTKT